MNARAWPDRRSWIECDRRWAQALNRAGSFQFLVRTCCVLSRLGDGVLWYVLIAVLPFIAGSKGLRCSIHMVLAGLVSLTIYLLLKRSVGRRRPYMVCPEIRLCGGRVLDQFSFPSGHTLHAAGFSCVLAYHFPQTILVLIPLTLMMALSRVILGLHYPSDVLGGAIFGALTGLLSIWLI